MGGSVTLFSMFFVTLVGYWYGIGTGLTAAMAYGLLQMVVDPYIISIPQMLMDYVFAFGALGLAGLFSGKKNGMVKGYIVGIIGRFVFSFLSGVIFFGMWAPESFTFGGVTIALNPYTYSALYNGSYIAAEGILTLIVLAIPAVRKAIDSVGKMAKA
ncbi:MAG: energy-coupled thiamine transporter ThiT [Lachnospiraceae bacterium]|nr:energy-coupled thiamine transporter ThiT [Lachnospiraceae bacterium]